MAACKAARVAVAVVIVCGALVSADMRDHGLGEVARMAACRRYRRLKQACGPGQPRCSCVQHQLFFAEDQPEFLQRTGVVSGTALKGGSSLDLDREPVAIASSAVVDVLHLEVLSLVDDLEDKKHTNRKLLVIQPRWDKMGISHKPPPCS